MTGPDLLGEAAAELYAADPEAFTERRGALAAQARAAGDAAAAKKIAGLRKPTRTAWLINRLVRADPGVPSRLAELGDELRAAQAALDGGKIRELSGARRQLMDGLIRQALQLPGQPAPTAALREELTATFGAALADPVVARDLAAGTLLRPVHRADFSPGGPGLVLVPSPAEAPTAPAAAPPRPAAKPAPRRAASAAAPAASAARDQAAAKLAAEAAAAAAAERAERERRRAIADAEQAEAGARQAAVAAAKAEDEHQQAVRQLEDQLAEVRQRLADARQRLAEARLRARKAESAQRRARQALSRLRD